VVDDSFESMKFALESLSNDRFQAASARIIRKVYNGLVKEGFTEQQALALMVYGDVDWGKDKGGKKDGETQSKSDKRNTGDGN